MTYNEWCASIPEYPLYTTYKLRDTKKRSLPLNFLIPAWCNCTKSLPFLLFLETAQLNYTNFSKLHITWCWNFTFSNPKSHNEQKTELFKFVYNFYLLNTLNNPPLHQPPTPPPPTTAQISSTSSASSPLEDHRPTYAHQNLTDSTHVAQYKLITNRVPYPILLYNWPFIIAGTHHRPWLISRIYSPIIMLINLCFPILYTNSYLSPDKSISYFFRQINWTAMVEYDLPLQKMFLSVSWDISCSWQWYTVEI